MSSSTSLPFLRPLALPKPSVLYRFFQTARASTSTSTSTSTAISSTKKSYWVTRTGTRGVPVYELAKRGGNLHQTKLRRIEGDIMAFKSDLQKGLNLEDREISINQLTQQIIIKGHKKSQVVKFLEDHNIVEDQEIK